MSFDKKLGTTEYAISYKVRSDIYTGGGSGCQENLTKKEAEKLYKELSSNPLNYDIQIRKRVYLDATEDFEHIKVKKTLSATQAATAYLQGHTIQVILTIRDTLSKEYIPLSRTFVSEISSPDATLTKTETKRVLDSLLKETIADYSSHCSYTPSEAIWSVV